MATPAPRRATASSGAAMDDLDQRMPLPVTPEEVGMPVWRAWRAPRRASGATSARASPRRRPPTPQTPLPHTPRQLEFLAEQELVTIVPSFSINPDVAPDGVLHIGSVSGAAAHRRAACPPRRRTCLSLPGGGGCSVSRSAAPCPADVGGARAAQHAGGLPAVDGADAQAPEQVRHPAARLALCILPLGCAPRRACGPRGLFSRARARAPPRGGPRRRRSGRGLQRAPPGTLTRAP